MLAVIPLGDEEGVIKRMPWVTIGIILLCFFAHLIVEKEDKNYQEKIKGGILRYIQYYSNHPYLKQEFGNGRGLNMSESQKRAQEQLFEMFKNRGIKIPDEETRQEEQEYFNSLIDELINLPKNHPYYKFGYIAKQPKITGLVSYMFIHGGWLHLILNLIFLYFVAFLIEDRWNKVFFASFYLAGGFVAAIMYGVHFPDFAGPLIGASGAIAAVMGAFLVFFWNKTSKFLLLIFFYPVKFRAPAAFGFLFWIGLEIYNAQRQAAIYEKFNIKGGGVAHWAHIWGFVFGVVVALAIKYFRVEEKYFTPKIQQKFSYASTGFEDYQEAMALYHEDKFHEAFFQLKEILKVHPANQEAGEALWEIGGRIEKEDEAYPFFLKTIESQIRDGYYAKSWQNFYHLKHKFGEVRLDLQPKISLVKYLLSEKEVEEAAVLLEEIFGEIGPQAPPGLLLDLYGSLVVHHQRYAQKLFSIIQQHELVPETKKEEMKKMLEKARRQPKPAIKTTGGKEPGRQDRIDISKYIKKETTENPGGPDKAVLDGKTGEVPGRARLKIMNAVPVRFKGDILVLKTEESQQKGLPIDRILAVSVVKISPPNTRPYLLIDLFLDNPGLQPLLVRLIRFFSTNFNPKSFAPQAANFMEAFQIFIDQLTQPSGRIELLPDSDGVFLKRVKNFSSLKQYESYILKLKWQ